jgi:hypothetical protein
MLLSKTACVIGREDNVVLVDFTRKPDPPAPKFPGANALRKNATEEVQFRLAPLRWVATL